MAGGAELRPRASLTSTLHVRSLCPSSARSAPVPPRTATTFRVWAPRPERIVLRAGGSDHELADAGLGVREATLPLAAGEDYAFVIDGVELPDPASRWQPAGLRGPSRVLDTARVRLDATTASRRRTSRTRVIYELHVGTFTPEGTFEAVIPHLRRAARARDHHDRAAAGGGVPRRATAGATTASTCRPPTRPTAAREGLQRLVDAAHAEGLAVLLDVVYNHVGASGAQALEAFGPYFTDAYETFWGQAINFDDADCGGVREWVLQSAEGWIRDFHLDGLRLDAIHAIFDGGAVHLVQALTARVHALDPRALVIAESGMNDPKVVRSHERGGWGCDARLGRRLPPRPARAADRRPRAATTRSSARSAHLAKAYRRPHVHDGGYSTFRRRRFGARADDVPPQRFVVFDQNHDQVGNRAFGDRLPPEARPLGALCTLLSPFTPMLFQGEEHGEHAPFLFFADHIDEEIAVATREGRRREFAAFAEFAGEEVPDPQDPATFQRSKLTRSGEPEGLRDLYARLLAARRAIGPGEAHADFDEHQGWLQRAPRRAPRARQLLPATTVHVPVDRAVELELATHHATVEPGHVVLPPLAGALVR